MGSTGYKLLYLWAKAHRDGDDKGVAHNTWHTSPCCPTLGTHWGVANMQLGGSCCAPTSNTGHSNGLTQILPLTASTAVGHLTVWKRKEANSGSRQTTIQLYSGHICIMVPSPAGSMLLLTLNCYSMRRILFSSMLQSNKYNCSPCLFVSVTVSHPYR